MCDRFRGNMAGHSERPKVIEVRWSNVSDAPVYNAVATLHLSDGTTDELDLGTIPPQQHLVAAKVHKYTFPQVGLSSARLPSSRRCCLPIQRCQWTKMAAGHGGHTQAGPRLGRRRSFEGRRTVSGFGLDFESDRDKQPAQSMSVNGQPRSDSKSVVRKGVWVRIPPRALVDGVRSGSSCDRPIGDCRWALHPVVHQGNLGWWIRAEWTQ